MAQGAGPRHAYRKWAGDPGLDRTRTDNDHNTVVLRKPWGKSSGLPSSSWWACDRETFYARLKDEASRMPMSYFGRLQQLSTASRDRSDPQQKTGVVEALFDRINP